MSGLLAAALLAAIAAPAAPGWTRGQDAESEDRIVIPFDFESRFDDGRYGRIVGDLVWKRLDTRGDFVIPESMLDVRDWASRTNMSPNPQTPLDEMRRIVRDDFGADIGIWGKVERVAGHDWDVYDFTIRIADFREDPPKIIHEATVRTKTVSEIPHVYVKAALDRLYGVRPGAPPAPDPSWAERWETEPSLVQGDFEQGARSPSGWDPLPEHVTLVPVKDDNGQDSRVIRFTIPRDVAASTGVLYYSDTFPIEEGARYRFQCRWRTTGSAAKVFIKCYDEISTKYSEGKNRGATERREVYRSQQNMKGEKKVWNTHTQDFTPSHTHYAPTSGRVMLYAYWPEGVVDWDDIVLKQIAPPPAEPAPKVKRPSLETKVRSDEIGRP